MTKPFITVVIATLDRAELLVRCVDSVLACGYEEFEIIVVDQGRDNRTKDAVSERYGADARVRYVNLETVGVGNARHAGYLDGRGEIIAYIDDDAEAAAGWLCSFARVFASVTPPPGMAGGRLLPRWERPCPRWYPDDKKYLLGLYDIGAEARDYPGNDLPPGANCAVSRKAMDAIGGFDWRLGFNKGRRNSMLAGEDTMLAMRMKAAGYRIYYYPDAVVYHYIAGYKLTKKYFLRRNYWEGVTAITLMDYLEPFTVRRLAREAASYLKQRLFGGAQHASALDRTSGGVVVWAMGGLSRLFFMSGVFARVLSVLADAR